MQLGEMRKQTHESVYSEGRNSARI